MRTKDESIDWKNLQVLIVDDQQMGLDVLRDMLYKLDVSIVLTARDGVEALKLTDTYGDMINLVICDWNMPKMSGIELLKQLRGAFVTQPFLMVTGRGDVASVVEAKQAGVTGYILKPFSIAEFESKIAKVLKMHT